MLNTRQLICAGLLVASATLAAHTNSSSLLTPIDFANFAKTNFWAAQSRHKAHAGEIEMAEFARACFDLGEFATNSSERADLAIQGIAVCRQLIGRNRKSVEGHYFLAMNL